MARRKIRPLGSRTYPGRLHELREQQRRCLAKALGLPEEVLKEKETQLPTQGLPDFTVPSAQAEQWRGKEVTLLIYDDIEKEKNMELKIRGSEVIYDAGDREYRLTEMQESHIMNVLGKFELQRMVLTRLAEASTLGDNAKQLKFCTKKIEKLDKKTEVFIEELMRRSKAEKALKKLKESIE